MKLPTCMNAAVPRIIAERIESIPRMTKGSRRRGRAHVIIQMLKIVIENRWISADIVLFASSWDNYEKVEKVPV